MASGARHTAGIEPPDHTSPLGASLSDAQPAAPPTGFASLPRAPIRQLEVTDRLVESARELVRESDGPGFTVTQVVAAAGTSLKSFYRCFAGKDDLLGALFEDDARRGASALLSMVGSEADPVERLRLVVVGLFRFLTVEGRLPYAAAL